MRKRSLTLALRACLVGGVLLSAFSCVTGEGPKPKQLSDKEEEKLNEYKAELELGRNMAGRLLQFFGQVDNAELIRYVNVVGNYVGGNSDAPERRYMFSILNSETVNAFACPGGYVLITKGAVRLAESEAELAMILGHEVAHVANQHMFNTLKKMSKEELDKNAAAAEQGSIIPPTMRVRKRAESEESEVGSMVARYLAGSSGASLNILQAAKAGMSVILEKGLDKDLEFEADQEGVVYGVRSGYQPDALYQYLGRLNQKTAKKEKKVLSKTHPTIDERQARIKKMLDEMQAKSIVGADGAKRFKDKQNLLPAKT